MPVLTNEIKNQIHHFELSGHTKKHKPRSLPDKHAKQPSFLQNDYSSIVELDTTTTGLWKINHCFYIHIHSILTNTCSTKCVG